MIVKVIILLILVILLLYIINNNNKEFFASFISEEGKVGNVNKAGKDVSFKDVGNIPKGKYVVSPYDPGSRFRKGRDVVLKNITQCRDNLDYVKKEVVIGTATEAGNDRVCEELNQCDYESQYINNSIITNKVGNRINDNECADIKTCGEYEELVRPEMPQKAYSAGTCVKIGDIVINIEMQKPQNIFIKKKKYVGSGKSFNTIQSIKNYFNNLKSIQKNYAEEMSITSEITTGIDKDSKKILDETLDCYYKKHNNFVCYLLDLRIEKVKSSILKKHIYLDIPFIERMTKNIKGPIYLFILGKSVDENIPMKLYNAENLVFTLIYKDQTTNDEDTTEYIYDNVKYDINLFYEYNKEFAISLSSPNKKYLEYFLKTILFSKVIPSYKHQLINKTNKEIQLKVVALYGTKQYNITKSSKSISQCNFDAKGDTLFDCKNKCNNFNNCTNFDCSIICENCNNDNCLWTIKQQIDKDLLSPDSAIIKGFSGDKLIKVTWMKPHSPSEIVKYYIIVTSPVNSELLDIYSIKDNRDLCEYIITNLVNDDPYNIHVIVKNEIGLSKKSNKVTIVPNINSELSVDQSNNSFSNSLENYYKKQKGDSFSINQQKTSYERKAAIQDLKNIIKNDLKINIPTDSYNINIF